MTCINIEINQFSCKKIIITDYSEYDINKGTISFSVIKIKIPGQSKLVELKFNNNSSTILDSKNLGIQKILTDVLKDIPEGFYKFDIEVTQTKNGVITTSFGSFCHFNNCNIDCYIDKLKLDILSNKCCEDSDCSNKLKDSYLLLNDLELYRDGIKASAELCKEEAVKELYNCLKNKINLSDVQCKCK